jgi:hypothetical protein
MTVDNRSKELPRPTLDIENLVGTDKYETLSLQIDIAESVGKFRRAVLTDAALKYHERALLVTMLEFPWPEMYAKYGQITVLISPQALADLLHDDVDAFRSKQRGFVEQGILVPYANGRHQHQGFTFTDRYLKDRSWKQKEREQQRRPIRTKLNEDEDEQGVE